MQRFDSSGLHRGGNKNGTSEPDNGVWDTYYTVTVNTQSGNLNFRSSPEIKSDNIIGSFKKGDITTWTGKTENGFSEVITSNGTVGWVSSNYILK